MEAHWFNPNLPGSIQTCRSGSSAKLGLDPTNTRPMTPTTMFNAFLFTLWSHTVYRTSAPYLDSLRELFPVYEVNAWLIRP